MNLLLMLNRIIAFFLRDWKRYLVILTPFVLLWLPLMFGTPEARCTYVVVIMAIYYMTEALPLSVTALIPVFAFPFFGIVSTNDICMQYMRGTTMMFFGGLAVATAVEHCNLHKRIALFVILKVGQSPRRLTGGFLLTSMFLSMWISNTAATAMMVPILDAILQELYKDSALKISDIETFEELRVSPHHQIQEELVSTDLFSCNIDKIDKFAAPGTKKKVDPMTTPKVPLTKMSEVANEDRLPPPDAESEALSTMCFLATAYGSNLGGTGFPTGAGANLILWGLLQTSFPDMKGLDFATWMAFNVPGMLICVAITWIWLEVMFMGCGKWRKMAPSTKEKEDSIKRLVQHHYDALGDISFHELGVLTLFLILVGMWVFRSPQFISGWAEALEGTFETSVHIGNASPAILIVFLMFVVPSKNPWGRDIKGATPPCLTWDAVHKKVPWGLVLLTGGGLAMAEGAKQSGLSTLLKAQLQGLQVLPGPAIVLLVCLITTFLTEIISNITAASILLPILKDMASGIGMHPLYLMLPATVCCSYAFMLPVGNPSNAIAFNASTMKNSDMIKAGFVLKFFCVFVVTGLITTFGVVLFDLNTVPEWATSTPETYLEFIVDGNFSTSAPYS